MLYPDGLNEISTDELRLKDFESNAWYAVRRKERACECRSFVETKTPCKHLKAIGVYSKLRPFIPLVRPTYSQALSGLVKSIRLRRVVDAIYWLVYLDRFSADNRASFRTARRVLIASSEDGHSVPIMEEVASKLPLLSRVDADLRALVTEAVKICKLPNWWDRASGGSDYIYSGMVGERRLLYGIGAEACDEITDTLEHAIAERDKAQALAAVMAFGQATIGTSKQAAIIGNIAQKHAHFLAWRLVQVHLSAKAALSGDNNFLCQAAWMMAGGVSPYASERIHVDPLEVDELIEIARERWKTPKPIPEWCCDGTHSAGRDERFMGVWPQMFAACNAFRYYGRVDPQDSWMSGFYCNDGLIVDAASELAHEIAINCKNQRE